jgi:hypothetical protein
MSNTYTRIGRIVYFMSTILARKQITGGGVYTI